VSAARREATTAAVSGLLSSAALFAALLALVYRPARIVPAAIVLALVAARMSDRHRRLAGVAVGTTSVCWVVGMTIAVVTNHPLF
jgi:hypothetical protein